MKNRWKTNFFAIVLLVLLLAYFSFEALAIEQEYGLPVAKTATISRGYFLKNWSVNGTKMQSEHRGVDFAVSKGSPIYATKSGTVEVVYSGCVNYNALSTGVSCLKKAKCKPKRNGVTFTGKYANGQLKELNGNCNHGSGNGVIIKHVDGKTTYYSHYAHMSEVSVSTTQEIKQGQEIGKSGSSGNSQGPHLHFVITKGGTSVVSNCINNNMDALPYKTKISSPTIKPPTTTPTTSKTTSTATISNKAVSNLKNTSARINAIVSPSTKIEKHGFYLGADAVPSIGYTGMENKKYESAQKNVTVGDMFFDVGTKYAEKLTPGTVYKYRFFVVVGGKEITGTIGTFTTTGTAPKTVTTKQPTTTATKEKHTIILDPNGGTVSQTSFTVDKGTLLFLPIPTREGYNFAGWYNDESGATWSNNPTISMNATLIAKWEEDFSTTATAKPTTTPTTTKATTTTIKPTSTMAGTTTTKPITASTTTTTVALTVEKFTVTLHLDGGTLAQTSFTVEKGSSLTLPTPTKAGYTFAGWYNIRGAQMSNVVTVMGDTNLTAQWTEDTNNFTTILDNPITTTTTQATTTTTKAVVYKTQYRYMRYVNSANGNTSPVKYDSSWNGPFYTSWSDTRLSVSGTSNAKDASGNYYKIYKKSGENWYCEETRQVPK